jgi:CheY-like chemotaxis protein
MHGRIQVRSTLGEGSEFAVELPLVESEPGRLPPQPTGPAPQRREAPSVAQALAQNQLILLAEDNETNRDVMGEQLRLLGYAAEVAEDGAQALKMWRSGRYALLLTDCHMPHMDGFALTQAIRLAEPQGTHLPIVAITANAMQGDAERCHDHGMDDYMSKPLRLIELAAMLAKWLPQSAGATGIVPAPLASADVMPTADDATPEPAAIWDATALTRLIGPSPVMQRQLLDKFLISAPERIAAIIQAQTEGTIATVALGAHTLKSAARTVGAMVNSSEQGWVNSRERQRLQPVHRVELLFAPPLGVSPHAPCQAIEQFSVVVTQGLLDPLWPTHRLGNMGPCT